MSNKYSLPYNIRMECIAYVRGYPRRVRAYNAAREEVLESSAYAMSGMPHSPGNSRIAERKAERLATIESWPETKKMRAVEYAMENVGRDIANEDVRRKLVWAIMRNCDSQKQYPIEMISPAGISPRTFRRRKDKFLWLIAQNAKIIENVAPNHVSDGVK